MRWKEDGGDFHTGCQSLTKNGRSKGPGGMVCWKVSPRRYTAYAWARGKEFEKDYKTVVMAKKAVERYLADAPDKAKSVG